MIIIDQMGERVVEKVRMEECEGCGKMHHGRCMKEIANLSGRWFFITEERMVCKVCRAKFGGGSMSRPDGSGLKEHLSKDRKGCGSRWKKGYYEDCMKGWDNLEEEFKFTLVKKWISRMGKGRVICTECCMGMKTEGLKEHIRREGNCYNKYEGMMKKDPAGTDVRVG